MLRDQGKTSSAHVEVVNFKDNMLFGWIIIHHVLCIEIILHSFDNNKTGKS